MTDNAKRLMTGAAAVGVIVFACVWIYFGQTSDRRQNVALHTRVGEELADQVAALIGRQGKVVTIAIPDSDWPELKTQVSAFNHRLRALGQYEVRDYEMDTKDQPKYGLGTGLSGRRYVRTVNKNTNASVFVSFIGAPKLGKEEIAELQVTPKLIAESRGTDNLPNLFQHRLIDVAVVSRFQFPSPGPENPSTPEAWFAKRYQIVTVTNAASLPKPNED